jgi:ribosomal protein S18 acetylase RimI-like enzyme
VHYCPREKQRPARGLYGWTWGGCGYIDLLWVRDDQRGRGLGTRLLTTAEGETQRRGCDRVALSTHSFQAPDFYARFGYQECGRTPAYPHGYDHIHLLKRLGADGTWTLVRRGLGPGIYRDRLERNPKAAVLRRSAASTTAI